MPIQMPMGFARDLAIGILLAEAERVGVPLRAETLEKASTEKLVDTVDRWLSRYDADT